MLQGRKEAVGQLVAYLCSALGSGYLLAMSGNQGGVKSVITPRIDSRLVDATDSDMIPLSQNDLGRIHRTRVANWQTQTPSIFEGVRALDDLKETRFILNSLDACLVLSSRTNEPIRWEQVEELLHKPALLRLSEFRMRTQSLITDRDLRTEIGWGWGLCGNRHCGPLADAEKALSTLSSQGSMLTANEARFLIDVAKRSVDEVMAFCDAQGFHAGSTHTGSLRKMGPETDYLSLSDLNEILGSDTDANNDERVMDMYEAELLKKFFAEDQSTIPAQGEREAEESLRRELSLHLHLAM